ncbi:MULTISPECIES: thiolase family protein [unclassified Peribacillus]|uniref:thiolase family protein n=1 Tax=unclassified Peribacillus TaxID=2675266 RepID=UPI0019143C07|nr:MULTISPECIES: thiolase family protein [unclassified Peribacillus]MBK5446252.1 thiolase family protein [Peribacillus sp. TH24]MBK5459079.1 thiolase family protein [Peribacillus sp. TH27]MBK5502443.1 thiolase family protein [Peribacillus sp. TH14]
MGEDIVIVSAVRTPIGRYGGAFKEISSGHLASIAIKEAIKRANIEAEQVDEVILGEVRQTTESSNVARVAALRSGIPDSAPAFTVNRLCASGMQAITSAAQQIRSGQANIVVAGGTENMSRSPIYLRSARFGGDRTKLVDSNTEAGQQPQEIYGENLGMGITAENVAIRYKVSREEQDAFSVGSQRRAAKAMDEGKFKDEIVPVQVIDRKSTITIEKDEYPRPDTTREKLANLKPAFKENGTVTAGNACGRNDGASALVLMKASEATRLELKPIAKIVDWATAGVSPEVMGIGPVPAVGKLLERTGKKVEEIGLFELNEAFASQALAVIRELGLDENKVNVNGGAIALGHPVGSTGARIVTTLIHEMIRRQERYGIATLCVGGGQGMAILIETI